MEQLTKYEKARIVGARALQLAMGAPMFVKTSKQDLENIRYSTVEIAKRELEKDLIPIGIRRPLPERIENEDLFNVEDAEEAPQEAEKE
tara:strand:- start:423 stop:689 length:267 start_codon:yes stop_codon:yes gene_type:complete